MNKELYLAMNLIDSGRWMNMDPLAEQMCRADGTPRTGTGKMLLAHIIFKIKFG